MTDHKELPELRTTEADIAAELRSHAAHKAWATRRSKGSAELRTVSPVLSASERQRKAAYKAWATRRANAAKVK